MGSIFTTIALPVALAIVMFGLGLGLTRQDFGLILKHPKVTLVALACQVIVMPVVCFGLVLAFGLPPELAVGMMLLAAAPGGTSANLVSHVFRGDVALNISLTAVNSVLALVTLPVMVNLSAQYFDVQSVQMGSPFQVVRDVFVIVLLPVILGMLTRAWRPGWAQRMDRPVRLVSAVILVLVLLGAIAANWDLLRVEFGRLAMITVLFCLISLSVGLLVPRWFGATRRQSIATSFEIGIHNATLAIVVAQTVLNSVELSLPAAVYGVLMVPLALGFGALLRTRVRLRPDPVV
ncbi:bile acid:sodium symporter family protein [Nakamurella multipartita]|jgi:BASS family bile acid:Na+ symporter|uniref:Bile acid:sodium symporter n=1 Tax=Nakamurella multipartita (strain ATCC 700099 / DSM 44233 / CIP 104796 / JCM 9543 / NBRC 105858 / Y-104) TaxID=479431 RepID=C8XHV7_NAKMY|nr:bile acid:sodium symporter family protein [Nakamurella multipartita]ACV76448.1 Bile acid:sodium symporter [Nakamurella multipartita DSM 44233]HOZ57377.1 bile acid:sodium symporter family protein [Nakamurella multipartita]